MKELLTRQGVRDLDGVGKKSRRGHVGRPVVEDQRSCQHIWLEAWEWNPYDRDYGLDWLIIRKCRVCGYVEKW